MKRLYFVLILILASFAANPISLHASGCNRISNQFVGSIPSNHLQQCLEVACQTWNFTMPLAMKYYYTGDITIEIMINNGTKFYMVEYDGLCVAVLIVGF